MVIPPISQFLNWHSKHRMSLFEGTDNKEDVIVRKKVLGWPKNKGVFPMRISKNKKTHRQ
jgi:hypothetical protein